MAINKLKALHAFIVGCNFVDENAINSWAEDATASPRSRREGNGLVVCDFEYTAVVSLDSFSGDEDLLLALVSTWLMTHDPDRDGQQLGAPEVDLEIVDDQLANVDISLKFKERICIVPAAGGPIQFRDKTWALQEPEIFIADRIALTDNLAGEHDAEYVRPD